MNTFGGSEVVIAHAADISNPGGGTERICALASGLRKGGHDVTLVVPRPGGSLPERLNGVRTETVSVRGSGVPSQPFRGRAIIRRAQHVADRRSATLQIAHSPLAGLGSILGAKEYVLDMHDFAFPSPLYGDLPLGRFIQLFVKYIEGYGLRNASHVIVVSELMKRLVVDTWSIPVERITTIPNGYFHQKVEPHSDVETVDGRVAFLGSLHPKLSVEEFEAVSRLPEVSELVIVGDGKKRSELESIESEKVSLAGYLPDEDAFNLISSAEVVINPQRVSRLQRASSPVKIYYYAALGVPMVLTEGPDVVRTLQERDAAIVVPENGDFKRAVKRVLNNKELQQAMKESLDELSSEFTWETRVRSLLKLYDTPPNYMKIGE